MDQNASLQKPAQSANGALFTLIILATLVVVGATAFTYFTKSGQPAQQSIPKPANTENADNPFAQPTESYENPFDQQTAGDSSYQNPFIGLQ